MNKKSLFIVVLITLMFVTFLLGACKDAPEQQPNNDVIVISQQSFSIDQYKTHMVFAQNPDGTNASGVSWSTSNSSVATVENGIVYGVGEGIAIITATRGSCSVSCTVTVASSNVYPILTLSQTTARIKLTSELHVGVSLIFDGVEVTEFSVVCSSSNDGIACAIYDNGYIEILTASVGTAKITVTAEYMGMCVTDYISVEVICL